VLGSDLLRPARASSAGGSRDVLADRPALVGAAAATVGCQRGHRTGSRCEHDHRTKGCCGHDVPALSKHEPPPRGNFIIIPTWLCMQRGS